MKKAHRIKCGEWYLKISGSTWGRPSRVEFVIKEHATTYSGKSGAYRWLSRHREYAGKVELS